jgi:hypothetical protein
MVNVRFPLRCLYGFEMVDARRLTRDFDKSRHQSKIYTESNQSDFLEIFGGLTSTQTLAIYRRLLSQTVIAGSTATEPRRRPGSRDVLSASHGVLARAGARAAAQGEDT